MGIAMFDVISYMKRLQAAGVTEAVATIQAEALAEVIENDLVTKKDLKDLSQELRTEMQLLEQRLDHKIDHQINQLDRRMDKLENQLDKVTYQLTIRLGSLLAAGILLLETLHKFL